MATKRVARIAMIATLLVVFALGYVCGSLSVPRASAQLPQIPGGLSGQSGLLGSAAKLGSSITEMEQHVSGLQKNIDTLKQIQSVLGGK